ncbi:MAG: HipA domain-containing protein [Oscillospiraceae bacterium]|nr:HipA domain-containing protein [Oscillospiraceae bacterium]MBQ9045818.1 HipA domain-containing protein [Oscillospiraceae bacterium]
MTTIDFTELKKKNKAYAGANGNKISVIYDGEQYMLKFPAQAKRNPDMSYSNSCFSEYLGCQIYESIGIPVQKTLLGTYTVRGKKKIVVACRDFTEPGVTLQDFASLKNQMIDSERNGYGTELSDILYTFEEQTAVDSAELLKRFWDMFIVDALIGNWDRHNGNWGFLYNTVTDEMTLAPVYDCGSSLYPQADEDIMEAVLADENERNFRIFDIPTSAITMNGKKIKYFDFISSLQNEDCNRALKRIVPRINMDNIKEIIDATPFMSDLQKRFYLTMLTERKARILDFSLASLEKRE